MKNRWRKKKIIKELGLLNKYKTASRLTLYQTLLSAGPGYSNLPKFSKLLCAYDNDYMFQSLQHEIQLRQQILHMQEYRDNGLNKFVSTAFFAKLKQQRIKSLRSLSKETVRDWTSRNMTFVPDKVSGKIFIPAATGGRRSAAPLDIVTLPGYDKLSKEERSLCSETRVQPEMFLEMKRKMVDECQKSKGLRLVDARPVVKIDVNKTRKVYDFLLNSGLIYKPAQI